MKKTLVAIAALAAFGAQAQSSATMYGVLDAGYSAFGVKAADGTNAKIAGIGYSAIDTSRWGITSTDDLGGGKTAGFVIESGLTGTPRDNFNYNGATSGTGTASNASKIFAATNADVGAVAGGGNFSSSTGGGMTPNAVVFGDRKLNVFAASGANKVQVGFDSSTIRDTVVRFQPMDGNMLGNVVANDRSLTGASAGQGRNKAISYIYTQPTWNATVGYVLGNTVAIDAKDTGNVTKGAQYQFNYAQGPLAFSAAAASYQGHVAAASAATVTLGVTSTCTGGTATQIATSGNYVCQVPAAAASDIRTEQRAAGVSYDLQVVKLTGQYGHVYINDRTGGSTSSNDNRDFFSVGAIVPVGAGNYFAQYSKGHDHYGSGDFNGNVTGYSVGYRYSLSKRTTAYAAAGRVKAETSATQDVRAAETSVGLLHAF